MVASFKSLYKNRIERCGHQSFSEFSLHCPNHAHGPKFDHDSQNCQNTFCRDRMARDCTIRLCLLFIHPRASNWISLQSAGINACMISSFVRALIAALKARPELALGKVALRASGDSGFSPTSAGSRFRLPSRFQTRRGPGAPVLSSFVFLDTTRRATGLRRPLRADVCNAAKTGRRTTRPERED